MLALGYTLIELLLGSLPWNNRASYKKAIEMRLTMDYTLINSLPVELKTYMNYCNTIRYEDKPDYNYMRSLFSNSSSEEIPIPDSQSLPGPTESTGSNEEIGADGLGTPNT